MKFLPLKTLKIELSPAIFVIMLVSLALSFAFAALLKYFFPSHIPFTLFEFFGKCDLNGAFIASKWAFIWIAIATILACFLGLNSKEENYNAEANLGRGIVISCIAGFYEETIYRWLAFLTGMVMCQVMNWIFLGFLGVYPLEWLNIHIVVPVADFMTAYQMTPYLRTTPWYIAAGMLAANAAFRDQHKYLGLFGFINSWYMGLFFFYIMFTYGLVPAMIVHAVYDIIFFSVRYADAVLERKWGMNAD